MNLQELLAQLSENYDAENLDVTREAVTAIDAETLPEVQAHLASTLQQLNQTFADGEGTEDDLETMRETRAILNIVDERIDTAEARAEEMAAEAAELAGEPEASEEEGESEEEEETPEGSESEEEEEEEPEASTEEEEEREPVAASNRPLPRPGRLRDHLNRTQEQPDDERPATIVAAGDVDGFRPGTRFQTPEDLARALHDTARATRGGHDGRRYVVAQMNYEHGTALTPADGMENFGIIREVQRQFENDPELDPITASGGFCAPETPLYGFFNIVEEDGLLTLPALDTPRGRVSIPDSPSIDGLYSNADWYAAIGDEWTEAEDEAVDPTDDTTWKNCFFVPCDTSTSFQIKAAVTCLEFGNFVAKFWPESVRNNTELSLKAHTHKVNAQQISDLAGLGTTEAADDSGDHGAIPQLLHNLEVQADEYRDKYRMSVNARLDLKLPFWVMGAVFADYVYRISTTDFARARAWLNDALSRRGFNVEYLHDWQSIIGDNQYPATVEAIMFAPGTAVRFDEGQLNFGITRDTTTNRQNQYQQFLETFQGVGKVGHEIRRITGIPIYPTGETGTHSGVSVPAS